MLRCTAIGQWAAIEEAAHCRRSNQKALTFIQKVNSDIEAHNKEKDYSADRGKFPLKYLQDKYKDTQTLRKTYKDTNNPEKKKGAGRNLSGSQYCNSGILQRAWLT